MTHAFRFSLTAILLHLAVFTHAQKTAVLQDSPLTPEQVGVSPQQLDNIREMLQHAVQDNQIPGVVALIAKDGEIVFHEAFGASNQDGDALKKDAIFRIASQTKAISATAVMMLWEEGKFRLDDPISRYLPEFKDPEVLVSFNEADSSYTSEPAETEITIRHLLTHTSGLGYGVIDGDQRMRKIYAKAGIVDLYTTKEWTIEENTKILAGLPLKFVPGQAYHYSEGLDVLGRFVEVISGQAFDVFLKQRIFEPLEMKDTYFYLPPEKSERLVAIQHESDGQWKDYPVTFYDPAYPIAGARSFFSGGAGLSSTATDYAQFLQMYLNGGSYNGHQLLSPTTINTIMKNQAGNHFGGDNNHHGLAFSVLTKSGEAVGGLGSEGTFDWGGYFNTQYFADPKHQVIGIILKQTQDQRNDATSWKFRQMVISSITQ